MSEIARLESPIGTSLYTTEFKGQTIFAAKWALSGLSKTDHSQALSALDDDEVVDLEAFVEGVKIQKWVTEPGLYRLAATARSPRAKKFQRWVFHEVLPSIRRTGAYMDQAVQTHLENLISDLQSEIAELRSQQKAIPAAREQKKPIAHCPEGHNTYSKDKHGGGYWYCTGCWAAGLPPFRIYFR